MAARWRPYRSYTYCITSSRRSCSKSTSMSGGSSRSLEMKRSNSTSWSGLQGSTAVTPRQKQTDELAAEPRPWQRMPWLRAQQHDVVHGEEVVRVAELLDQGELLVQQIDDLLRHAARIAPGGAGPGEVVQVLDGGLAGRHRLVRVFVAQLARGEAAALGDLERARHRLRPVLRTAAPSRPGDFRCRSALASSRRPASAIVHFSRMQVSTSCSGRRSGPW